jgi:hypothetical protein
MNLLYTARRRAPKTVCPCDARFNPSRRLRAFVSASRVRAFPLHEQHNASKLEQEGTRRSRGRWKSIG